MNSIRGKDLEALKITAGLGLNLRMIDSRGNNLLAMAVELNNLAVVEYLIVKCGMDVNALIEIPYFNNTKRSTPAIYLAWQNHLK